MSSDYAELTTNNSSALKRFSHGRRFRQALALMEIKTGDRVLDFGAGDGFMMRIIASTHEPGELVGYEPMESQYVQLFTTIKEFGDNRLTAVGEISRLCDAGFDKICCLEVLEHLTKENQLKVLSQLHRLLSPSGLLVVSVPIEIGPAGLFKNAMRRVLRQEHDGATCTNIVKAFAGLNIDRADVPYIASHIGFDHRVLPPLFLANGFSIVSRHFSPLPILGSFFNSQIFLVLQRQ